VFADSFYGHSLKSAFEFSLPFEGKRFLYHAPLLPRSGSGRQGVLNAVEVEHKGGHIYIYIYITQPCAFLYLGQAVGRAQCIFGGMAARISFILTGVYTSSFGSAPRCVRILLTSFQSCVPVKILF